MYFITEKEIEALLKSETRPLPMPDGSTQYFQGFKLMWDSVDYLTKNHNVTLEWLIELAISDSDGYLRPFYRMFPNTVAYVRQEYDKAFGE